MKSVLILMALMMGAHQVQAQDEAQDQNEEQIVRRAPSKKRQVVRYEEESDDVIEEEARAPRQPIYIMNNQKYQGYQSAQQKSVQEQPVSIIEAPPLSESRADALRKSRQGIETGTEQKIVEKLEESRIEDEKARAERLFGNKFANPIPQNQVQEVQPPVVLMPPTVEVPSASKKHKQIIEEEEEEISPRISIREEIRDAVRDLGPHSEEVKPSYFIGAKVGMASYPDVVNIRGNVASGFSLGMVSPEQFVVEGSFLYSEYDIELLDFIGSHSLHHPPFKSLEQYNLGAAVKYQILPGKIRPVLGAAADYTYRKYKDRQYSYTRQREVTTGSFDVGIVTGLDVEMTKTFSLGADFRYYTNIATRTNSDYQESFVNVSPRLGTPVEKLDYYIGTLVGKFTF